MERLDELRNVNARRTILVVEDNEMNREMLRMFLEDDFDVIEAENGLVGLERLEESYRNLSLVLLDVYMPECDGFEFLRRMRRDERYTTVPVIVATASQSVEDEIRCLEFGANDFIVKPYNFEIMINRINNMIRLRESAALVNQLSQDRTTGLFSKEYFFRSIDERLRTLPDVDYDMVCSDIENFKALNDRYSEQRCDELLHELAGLIVTALPGYIAGGRIGGDSFAFLIEHGRAGWEDALRALSDQIDTPGLSLKFGIVEHVDHDLPSFKTCNRAISAIETLKGIHGIGVAFFDDELHKRQLLEQALRDCVEAALAEGQFCVYYQPKCNPRTGEVGGAEALVRWFHPEFGFVSPGVFIPLFERSGFITNIDMFVWEEACKEVDRCRELGLPSIPISVNASRRDFDVPGMSSRVAALADDYGVDHALLHVELTETAFADNPETVAQALSELRACGFLTELDDFGSGYSSLASLNTLPVDVMKLDMSIVQQASRLDDFRIVESAIRLAQALELRTVVEGVETSEEAEKVGAMGCDLIQGYFYSKPLNQDDFEQYLRDAARVA